MNLIPAFPINFNLYFVDKFYPFFRRNTILNAELINKCPILCKYKLKRVIFPRILNSCVQ